MAKKLATGVTRLAASSMRSRPSIGRFDRHFYSLHQHVSMPCRRWRGVTNAQAAPDRVRRRPSRRSSSAAIPAWPADARAHGPLRSTSTQLSSIDDALMLADDLSSEKEAPAGRCGRPETTHRSGQRRGSLLRSRHHSPITFQEHARYPASLPPQAVTPTAQHGRDRP